MYSLVYPSIYQFYVSFILYRGLWEGTQDTGKRTPWMGYYPISLERIPLDWRTKLETPEESPKALGEHANTCWRLELNP